jgi:hypothetical protein
MRPDDLPRFPLAAVLETLGIDDLGADLGESHVIVDDTLADAIGAALERRYHEEFRSWNWDLARTSAEEVDGDDGDRYAVAYIGSVFSLTPSGKVYAFWTTNQTEWDVFRDSLWWKVLDDHLDKLGAFVWTDDCGDGDGVRVAWHLGCADDDDDDDGEE